MKLIKYILINESYSQDAVLAIRNSPVSDFRHSHIINAAGLTHPELVNVLLFARKQWPSAKILGISEILSETRNLKPETRGNIRDHRLISSGRIHPTEAMNALRRELSNYP